MTWRGSAASRISVYSAVSVFGLVENEGGDEDCALQRPSGRRVGRTVIADIFCSVCTVHVCTVKVGQVFGRRVCVRVCGERVTCDKTTTIAKETLLWVS